MTSSAPTSSAVPAAALSAGPLLHQPAPAGVTLAGVSPAALQASYQHCRRVTRAAARNFYYGLRLTPEPRRSAVFAMYAWMRTGDDIVDAQGTQHFKSDLFAAFKRLTWQVIAGDLSETDRCDCGPKGGVTFWPAFAHTVGTYGISREIIAAMLAGLQADLEHTPLVANADLERYCDQVGSSVGLACVRIWGLRPGASPAIVTEKAIARGRAFQLTNILRDVAQDYDAVPSRVYIPQDSLLRHGLTAKSLRDWADPARCLALMNHHIGVARDYYLASAGLENLISADCSAGLWGMTRIYSQLLERIAEDPAAVFSGRRVRLSGLRKVSIAISAAARARTANW